MYIKKENITNFRQHLIENERTNETISKYMTDIKEFCQWNNSQFITKQTLIDYKSHLQGKQLNPVTINSKLSAINGLFKFLGLNDYCVRFLKIQRKVFRSEEKELTKNEYERLIQAAYK